ncbi:hypothetical protein FKM82_023517 [Ascaphus truei]
MKLRLRLRSRLHGDIDSAVRSLCGVYHFRLLAVAGMGTVPALGDPLYEFVVTFIHVHS